MPDTGALGIYLGHLFGTFIWGIYLGHGQERHLRGAGGRKSPPSHIYIMAGQKKWRRSASRTWAQKL